MKIFNIFQKKYIIVTIVSLIFFHDFFQMTFLGTVGEHIISFYNLTSYQYGQVSSFYFCATALFLIPASILLDRIPARKIFISVMSIYTICPLIYAYLPGIHFLYFGRILSGAAGAFCLIGCIVMIKRWISSEHIYTLINLSIVFGLLGGIASQVPFLFIVQKFGWQTSLFFISLKGLFILFLVLLFVQDPPNSEKAINKKEKFFIYIKEVYSNKKLWMTAICASILNLPIPVLGATWGNIYLKETSSLTNNECSQIVVGIYFGMILGALISIKYKNILSNISRSFLLSGIFTSTILFLTTFNKNYTFLIISFLLIGVSCSIHLIVYTFVANMLSTKNVGAGEGLVATLIMAIGAGFQIIGGAIIYYLSGSIFSSYNIFIYFVCFITIAISSIFFLLFKSS